MKVFVTGGSGFVGQGVIRELVDAGHSVLALARSDSAMKKVGALGAMPVNGSLSDGACLRKGAEQADAIIHLAYDNDMSHALKAAKADRAAIEAMADAIAGTNKPFIITSGVTGIFGRHQAGSERETPAANLITGTRLRAEKLLLGYADKGVKAMVVRLPPFVHGDGDKGFTPRYIAYARKNREANYVGDGENIWPAVHRFDAARLYRLAMEKGKAGSVYHAVAEGVYAKQVAAAVGDMLTIPLRSVSMPGALRRLSLFALIVSLNTPANSDWTQKELNWKAIHPDFLSDLKESFYFQEGNRK